MSQYACNTIIHSGGSKSFASHELALIKKNPDKVITEDDVFLRTHKRKQGSGEFVDAKFKKIFEDYTARKKGDGFDSTAWVDVSGGVVKNRLYDFGSLVPVSEILSSSTISSSTRSNGDFTQTQEFEDKLTERVEKMRDEVTAKIESKYEAKFEQMKNDFQLQFQDMLNLRT